MSSHHCQGLESTYVQNINDLMQRCETMILIGMRSKYEWKYVWDFKSFWKA